MPHTRVHVSFGTLDVVVQVVTEELNMANCAGGDIHVCKMTREEDKCYIANIFRVNEAGDMANLQRRITRGVQYLRCTLDCRQSSGIDEFLR